VSTLSLKHNSLSFTAIEHGTGPLVLCLHGFPDSPRSFRAQFDTLATAGYRVLAPTLRGYEPSSQPADRDYRVQTLASDVIAWLDHLGVERCHLVGHDWGAIISYSAAAAAPHRFYSLTTIAVPHLARMLRVMPFKCPSQIARSWYILFFQLRGIADYVLSKDDWALVDQLWRAWSPDYELPESERRALKQVLSQPGVKRAALSYYRSLPRAWFDPASRSLLFKPIEAPTLTVTGAHDGCMDTRLFEALMRPKDFPAGLNIARIADAGHFPHLERPEQVNRLLLDHFARSAFAPLKASG